MSVYQNFFLNLKRAMYIRKVDVETVSEETKIPQETIQSWIDGSSKYAVSYVEAIAVCKYLLVDPEKMLLMKVETGIDFKHVEK